MPINNPHILKRAQRGLYGGKNRLTGHTISASKRHTKRAWLPNVHRKRLYSEILNEMITIPVTTHVLRQMDRVGGFDEYLLRAHPGQLGSRKGEQLRKQLIRTMMVAGQNKGTVGMVPSNGGKSTTENGITTTTTASVSVPVEGTVELR